MASKSIAAPPYIQAPESRRNPGPQAAQYDTLGLIRGHSSVVDDDGSINSDESDFEFPNLITNDGWEELIRQYRRTKQRKSFLNPDTI